MNQNIAEEKSGKYSGGCWFFAGAPDTENFRHTHSYDPNNLLDGLTIGGYSRIGRFSPDGEVEFEFDGNRVLVAFARWVVLQVIHLWEDCPENVKKFLRTGDESLREEVGRLADYVGNSLNPRKKEMSVAMAVWIIAEHDFVQTTSYLGARTARLAIAYMREHISPEEKRRDEWNDKLVSMVEEVRASFVDDSKFPRPTKTEWVFE